MVDPGIVPLEFSLETLRIGSLVYIGSARIDPLFLRRLSWGEATGYADALRNCLRSSSGPDRLRAIRSARALPARDAWRLLDSAWSDSSEYVQWEAVSTAQRCGFSADSTFKLLQNTQSSQIETIRECVRHEDADWWNRAHRR